MGKAQISVGSDNSQQQGRKEGCGCSGPAEAPEGPPQEGREAAVCREGKRKKTPRARNPSCAWSRGRDIATVAPALRKHLQSGRVPSTLRRFSASERPLSPNPSGCHTFFFDVVCCCSRCCRTG